MFPICRNSSKIGFGKKRRLYQYYSVFKGCACRVGGVTIYIYMYIYIYVFFLRGVAEQLSFHVGSHQMLCLARPYQGWILDSIEALKMRWRFLSRSIAYGLARSIVNSSCRAGTSAQKELWEVVKSFRPLA